MSKWEIAQQKEMENYWNKLYETDTVENNSMQNWRVYGEVMDLRCRDRVRGSVIDIGGGPYSFLHNFTTTLYDTTVVDPMEIPKKYLQLYEEKCTTFIQSQAEWFLKHYNAPKYDEVWITNVLTHTSNPAYILLHLPKVAKVLRICEPIETPINVAHLHSFSALDYINYLSLISKRCYFREARGDEFSFFGGVFELKE